MLLLLLLLLLLRPPPFCHLAKVVVLVLLLLLLLLLLDDHGDRGRRTRGRLRLSGRPLVAVEARARRVEDEVHTISIHGECSGRVCRGGSPRLRVLGHVQCAARVVACGTRATRG